MRDTCYYCGSSERVHGEQTINNTTRFCCADQAEWQLPGDSQSRQHVRSARLVTPGKQNQTADGRYIFGHLYEFGGHGYICERESPPTFRGPVS